MHRKRLFVVGAQKAGTTSLHAYLDQHPQIFMSRLKEPTFFSQREIPVPDGTRLDLRVRTDADYQALFADARPDQVLGEASTAYLPSRWAPAHITERFADVSAVAVLRDPAERMFSAYLMARRSGTEHRAFDAVVDGATATDPLLRLSLYADDLRRWTTTLGVERTRFFLTEDLSADTAGVVREIAALVGVDPGIPIATDRRQNAAEDFHVPVRARRGAGLAVRRAGRAVLPRSALRRLDRWDRERRRSQIASITPDQRARVIAHCRADIDATEEFLGRDLTPWRTV